MALPLLPLLFLIGGAVVLANKKSGTSACDGDGDPAAFFGSPARFLPDEQWSSEHDGPISYIDIAQKAIFDGAHGFGNYDVIQKQAAMRVASSFKTNPPQSLGYEFLVAATKLLWAQKGCPPVGGAKSWPDNFRRLLVAVYEVERRGQAATAHLKDPGAPYDVGYEESHHKFQALGAKYWLAETAPNTASWQSAVSRFEFDGGGSWIITMIMKGAVGSGACAPAKLREANVLDPMLADALWATGAAGKRPPGLEIFYPYAERSNLDRGMSTSIRESIRFFYGLSAGNLSKYSESIELDLGSTGGSPEHAPLFFTYVIYSVATKVYGHICDISPGSKWMTSPTTSDVTLSTIKLGLELFTGSNIDTGSHDGAYGVYTVWSIAPHAGEQISEEVMTDGPGFEHVEGMLVRVFPDWFSKLPGDIEVGSADPVQLAVELMKYPNEPILGGGYQQAYRYPLYDEWFKDHPNAEYGDFTKAMEDFERQYPHVALAIEALSAKLVETFPEVFAEADLGPSQP